MMQQPGLTLIYHWKITSWRILGTKWVIKRDATAGERTDRKSKKQKRIAQTEKIGNGPHTGGGLQQIKQ